MLQGKNFVTEWDGLEDDSALFRHEVAFCLGQRQDPAAIQTLESILRDTAEHPMVRHEAGEALGAIGSPACIPPLRDHAADGCLEVAQTCQLALQRIEFLEGHEPCDPSAPQRYLSVDPTPPAPAATPTPALAATLLDDGARIFDRYRALFALRDRGGEEALEALAGAFASSSALLKHEVAYVLGQMQDARAVACLKRVLGDAGEAAMVRHEAAEALGAIADRACLALLQQYTEDAEPIVADSCIVALDMLEFEQSGGFQYADDGAVAT
ncbi:Deoxyhypusine hydroxylase [Auxenochlorella protothecoides]|uniref:Deoxyhypusine hydroxylase n=1 Tax=Auxenochlorella protothecoides TaxID=3075 RepID=A0A087SGL5_AUXPR|nr:Deoxyhypusine hydroxylase [Auxenochlorella protothecoides]KFM24869.1 Deoxyhypusine hydroxylase [Auxenochlorella protothecoides]